MPGIAADGGCVRGATHIHTRAHTHTPRVTTHIHTGHARAIFIARQRFCVYVHIRIHTHTQTNTHTQSLTHSHTHTMHYAHTRKGPRGRRPRGGAGSGARVQGTLTRPRSRTRAWASLEATVRARALYFKAQEDCSKCAESAGQAARGGGERGGGSGHSDAVLVTNACMGKFEEAVVRSNGNGKKKKRKNYVTVKLEKIYDVARDGGGRRITSHVTWLNWNHLRTCLSSSQKNRNSLTWLLPTKKACFLGAQ